MYKSFVGFAVIGDSPQYDDAYIRQEMLLSQVWL